MPKTQTIPKTELARIRRRIRERNNMWFNYFDTIIQEMVPYCCDTMTPKQLVDYAKETAKLIVEANDEHEEMTKISEQ